MKKRSFKFRTEYNGVQHTPLFIWTAEFFSVQNYFSLVIVQCTNQSVDHMKRERVLFLAYLNGEQRRRGGRNKTTEHSNGVGMKNG